MVVEREENKSPELVSEETAPEKKIGGDEAVTPPPRGVSAAKKTKTKKKSVRVTEEGGEKKNGVLGLFLAGTMVCAGVGVAGVAGYYASDVPTVVVKEATEMCASGAFWGGRESEQESLAGAVCVVGEEEQAFELSRDQ